MATPTGYLISDQLQAPFIDKETQAPMSCGKVYFYKDTDRTPSGYKPVYQQTGSPGNYTYVALPQPVELTIQGTPGDTMGNDIIIYLYPYDASGNIEQYFVDVYNADDAPQFTREGFPSTEDIGSNNEANDFYVDSGTANNYILTPRYPDTAPTAYYDGMRIRFFALNANTTTSIVNVNALGSKSIKNPDGSNLIASDIRKDPGYETVLVYSLIDGVFYLVGSYPNENTRIGYFSVTGSANSYTLTSVYPKNKATAYYDGMRIDFSLSTAISNTSASVVNVDALGNKDIVDKDGFPLLPNAIRQQSLMSAIYKTDKFFLQAPESPSFILKLFLNSLFTFPATSTFNTVPLSVGINDGYGYSAGTITFPYSGTYSISNGGTVQGPGGAQEIQMGTFGIGACSAYTVSSSGLASLNSSTIITAAAGNTTTFQVIVAGSSGTAGVLASSGFTGEPITYCSVQLIKRTS